VDFTTLSTLTFEEPDTDRFRNLALAYKAIERGGNMPCILNAANEVCVAAFLQDRIGFLEMSDVIAETMERAEFREKSTLDEYIETDAQARRLAASLIK
jgi:1-deoxy-D-xylulose-5-phosphate reductoisomerase